MADDLIYKQEFLIRNLSTRHVTLYPTKAQVVRDINDVTLRPGPNEITLYGITPTADESSIKVDGRGAATITDMMVDLVPNNQVYEDIYPETEDDEEDHIPVYPGVGESSTGNEETKAIANEIAGIDEEVKQIVEDHGSASGQLSILEKYKNTVDEKAPSDLPKFIQVYREERRKAFLFFHESESRMKMKTEQRAKVVERQLKALEALRKERAKLNKGKKIEAEKKARARKERMDAKRRLKEERSLFWPKKVYRVVISLDASIETPTSSRRGSVESLSTLKQEQFSGEACQISLSVSYVSSAGSWTPRYDLSLNTSSATGTIVYRAEYYNATSEVWRDAKVSLSTSEAAFQGLGQRPPVMMPWNIRLADGNHNRSSHDALVSNQEQETKSNFQAIVQAQASEPRSALFGLPNADKGYRHHAPSEYSRGPSQPLIEQQQQMQQQHQMQQMQQMPHMPQSHMQSALVYQQANQGSPRRSPGAQSRVDYRNLAEGSIEELDEASHHLLPNAPSLATEEATWAEEGLTFTYDIGVRTITQSFTRRRYRIVTMPLKNVKLSYLLVPKLQAAAFLKARILNPSSISLLRGMAGVTLDGSFLGNTPIPRCSAGGSFDLSLGVDPSVHVSYGKPTMHRNKESGLFFSQKEDSSVFTRTCTIMNTKSNRVIEGVMLDQVPSSQDERLKVWILQPTDINGPGSMAKAGEGLTRDGRIESRWGKAIATNTANGKIQWGFNIEPSRGGKFVLEYETRYPSGDSVIRA